MKKILIVLVLMLTIIISNAQSVNGVNVKDFKTEYIELLGFSRFLSNKVTVTVDYGQERHLFKNQTIKDENNKPIIFNSMIESMNFFKKYGYEFKQAYTVTTGNQNVYHWLLEKKN